MIPKVNFAARDKQSALVSPRRAIHMVGERIAGLVTSGGEDLLHVPLKEEKRSKSAALGRKGYRVDYSKRKKYACPVCYELCAQPVSMPCKHFLCFACHLKVFDRDRQCPMCRAQFDKLAVSKVDKDLQIKIATVAGAHFEKRVYELVWAGQWYKDLELMEVIFGNKVEQVVGSNGLSRPYWCLFFQIADDNHLTDRIVQSVTYFLPAEYCPMVVKTSQSPFLLKRIGKNPFVVRIEVRFQRYTGLETRTFWHELSFDSPSYQLASRF